MILPPTGTIRTVDYTDNLVDNNTIQVFLQKIILQHANVNSYKGIHISLLRTYKNLIYLIYTIILAILYATFNWILTSLSNYGRTTNNTLSIVLASTMFYLIYIKILVRRNTNDNEEYSEYAAKELTNIRERYYKNSDGVLYLTIMENSQCRNGVELIGMIGVKPFSEKEKSEHKLDLNSRVCLLEKMGVHESARGSGLGFKLIEKALGFTRERKYEFAALYVYEFNLPAIKLYSKFGFREVERIPYDKILGLSDLLMMCTL